MINQTMLEEHGCHAKGERRKKLRPATSSWLGTFASYSLSDTHFEVRGLLIQPLVTPLGNQWEKSPPDPTFIGFYSNAD